MFKKIKASLLPSGSEGPVGMGFFPNLVAFASGLGIAYYSNWEVRDLVWSLWLCSLVLGYLTLLAALAAGAYVGLHTLRQKDFDPERRLPAILAGAAIGLFFLGFFSLHFGAFHAGHSVFLQGFFPLESMPNDGFGRAFMNPPLLWLMVFRHLIGPYGAFLIPMAIAERQVVFTPLIGALQSVREGGSGFLPRAGGSSGRADDGVNDIGRAMFRPYVNVVRMHLLIFFFAFCYAVGIQSFIVFAVVYFVYFFPWSELKRIRKSRRV